MSTDSYNRRPSILPYRSLHALCSSIQLCAMFHCSHIQLPTKSSQIKTYVRLTNNRQGAYLTFSSCYYIQFMSPPPTVIALITVVF